jgi:hypothetical protein
MNNDLRELNIIELDGVSGGAGSLSDVMTYVKAYTAALGNAPEPNWPKPGDYPPCNGAPKNGQHG